MDLIAQQALRLRIHWTSTPSVVRSFSSSSCLFIPHMAQSNVLHTSWCSIFSQYVRLCTGPAPNCNTSNVSRGGAATHYVGGAAGPRLPAYVRQARSATSTSSRSSSMSRNPHSIRHDLCTSRVRIYVPGAIAFPEWRRI